MSYQPCTTFEGASEEVKRNGWEDGDGVTGQLKTEGNNGYWAGANLSIAPALEPVLKKKFDLAVGTKCSFSFKYRLTSEPTESFFISFTPDGYSRANTFVDLRTSINQWHHGETFEFPILASQEVWICLLASDSESRTFAIEFDDICVELI